MVPRRKRLAQVAALAWLAVIGLDLLLNAGLLARFFVSAFQHPCLLPPLKAFLYIPLGYGAFLLWCVLLVWIIDRLGAIGARPGAALGAKLGIAISGAGCLGMASMFSLPPAMLLVWCLDQTALFCLAGAVIGSGLAASRLGPLAFRVLALFLACVVVTAVMQNLGLAPLPAVR